MRAGSPALWLPGPRVCLVVASLLVVPSAVSAHSGHQEHAAAAGGGGSLALPLALFVGGALVLGTSVYLKRTDQLGGKLGDLGTLLGVLGLLAGGTLALV